MYTYCDDIISDLYKDVYGVRPREAFYADWNNCTPAEKQKTWDEYCATIEQQIADQKVREAYCIARFEDRIKDVIGLGAGDRTTALRWISQQETFYHIQDVEHFVWEQGLLFTDYGKALIKELDATVTYEEMF
tara:strand:- start:2205 stop:2603 length:399 start_codon:yes stop_codon:yes gene_type:complete